MHLEIVTPEKKLYSGDIEIVQLPGSNGSFEILENHAAIVSTLAEGTLKVKPNNQNEIFFDIKGGVVECNKNNITILAEV